MLCLFRRLTISQRQMTSWNQPKTRAKNAIKQREAANSPIRETEPGKCLSSFCQINDRINQPSKSRPIHFLSVDQLCRRRSAWRGLVWRRSGHWLQGKHHFLKHTPTSRPRGQSGAESDGVAEATCDSLTTAKVNSSAEPSKIYGHTFQSSLGAQEHGKERHVYEHTAALQAARHTSNQRKVGGEGEIKCLRQRLTIGF